MNKEHLYTVIIQVFETQEVFIHQLRTTKTRPNDILLAWVTQAVEQGFIKGTDDPKIPFRDIITQLNVGLKPLGDIFNAWEINFLIGKDFYSQDIIRAQNDGILNLNECIYVITTFMQTSVAASALIPSNKLDLTPTNSDYMQHAEEKYTRYKERYIHLKATPILSKDINKERKHVERWMLYWNAKWKFHTQFFNRDDNAEEPNLYTIHFDYEYYRNIGAFTYQLYLIGSDPNYVFYEWADRFMYETHEFYPDRNDKIQMINEQDRLMLMEKVSSGPYSPILIDNLENVWHTYFTLSGGMVKLIIIKTALDEVSQK